LGFQWCCGFQLPTEGARRIAITATATSPARLGRYYRQQPCCNQNDCLVHQVEKVCQQSRELTWFDSIENIVINQPHHCRVHNAAKALPDDPIAFIKAMASTLFNFLLKAADSC